MRTGRGLTDRSPRSRHRRLPAALLLLLAAPLARAVDVPRNYLGKILHELVRAGILKSTRGKGGGFELAVPPEELTLLKVATQFDRVGGRRCLLGRPECSEDNPCPVHDRWRTAAVEIEKFFDETTVADLLD